MLCAPLLQLYSQSYIRSIEHGVYIDHNLTYPYNQVVLTTSSGFYFEASMIDLPGDINISFNTTVQNRAGNLAYLINNMEEPVGHKGNPNFRSYYSIGYMTPYKKYRQGIQAGIGSRGTIFKVSQYYRAIDADGGFLDLGLHFQVEQNYKFIFFGYSYGLDLDPIR